ncbi:sucrose transport protein SUT4 [Cocos nucifera]|uniref:Sucrose transport protein SUT4 n=1 Tax=Cocos nucifera TaxID=13894 RepID=A0A8K0IKS9_COCNU|nr:sucrose transport protein SUT4 [Cocos nucifera]
MDAVSIRVPYRHLNDAELELVGLGDPNGEINEARDGVSHRPVSSSAPSFSSPHSDDSSRPVQRSSLKTLIFSCMVGAGVQFGWALQLSLLTPYIQTLGIGHAFSSFIWLCGPITGFVVQPCVGIWSDRCHSKYGRRRPFILAGCLMISLAVTLIGFSADVGYFLGDTKDNCSTYKGPRYRAATVFIFGFWMLDLANNTVQGPARALLADLAGPDQRNSANAIFCSWMAFGNILGFSSGASGNWHRWFPFLTTKACCEVCGNLKAAFLVAVAFLMFCMLVTLYFAKEVPLEARPDQHLSDSSPLLNNSQQRAHVLSQANLGQHDSGQGSETLGRANSDGHLDFNSDVNRDQIEAFSNGPGAVLVNILTSLRHLPPGMHSVLLVMALTWVSWFPFFLFDTDWMGREVYHGDPNGEPSESAAYQNGVREGAFGLLLNSVVLGVSSFLIDPMCRRMGARLVWAISNFTVFICMAATTIISLLSISKFSSGIQHVIGENTAIKIAALVIFSVLGFPLSITYSVPFSVTAELTAGTGGGQGLATGVLNLAIVIPQMIVSLGAGPWDALFGGGNVPAFALASIFALAAGILAVLKLPRLSNSYSSAGFHGFG